MFFKKESEWRTSLRGMEPHKQKALFFLSLRKPSELAKFFDIPFSDLEKVINLPEYESFTLPKRKGGRREILAPKKKLKQIQKHLNLFLQCYYLLVKPDSSFGFVKKTYWPQCNIADNARSHTNKKFVLNIDLKDFFPGIRAARVRKLFGSELFRFNQQLVDALTLLVTYQSRLPTGAPASPIISNFICIELDRKLKEFATKEGFAYSRYADDLTFSTNQLISDDDILDIILLIQSCGFRINEKKLRIKSYKQRQTVTGVVVNKKVNVDRRFIRKVRAMIFDLTTNGPEQAAARHFNLTKEAGAEYQNKYISKIHGYLGFINQVRGPFDPLYLKYSAQLTEYLNPGGIKNHPSLIFPE